MSITDDPGTFEGLDADVVEAALARWSGGEPTSDVTPPEPETTEADPAAEPEAEPTPATPTETEPDAPSPAPEPEAPEQPEPETPPSPLDTPPAEPTPAPEAPSGVVTLPDGRQVPAALIAQWLDGQQSAPAPAPVQTDPQGLALPPVTAEDLELLGPAGQAMLLILNEQAKQQQALQERLAAFEQTRVAASQAEDQAIVTSAVSQFAQTYALPDELMTKIRDNARADDVAYAMRTNGGNKYAAVEAALLRSYATLPEAQAFDRERRTEALAAADTRKRKLAGVGGPGGTAPRTTFDETTQEGRRNAAVAMVAEAMGSHK